MTKVDISTREEIRNIMEQFYDRVHQEPALAPVFDMPADQWENHLTRTVNFWENWLFQTGAYTGGMMWVHVQAHQKHNLSADLFERWLALWFLTIDSLHTGENATFMKNKALELAQIMRAKLSTMM